MKAILCTHFCTPDELELADIPQPTAGPGEAVVRVKGAALNFFDLLIIAGKYQNKPPFPFSPASEFAGIVESVGAGVTDVVARRPRDRRRFGCGPRICCRPRKGPGEDPR